MESILNNNRHTLQNLTSNQQNNKQNPVGGVQAIIDQHIEDQCPLDILDSEDYSKISKSINQQKNTQQINSKQFLSLKKSKKQNGKPKKRLVISVEKESIDFQQSEQADDTEIDYQLEDLIQFRKEQPKSLSKDSNQVGVKNEILQLNKADDSISNQFQADINLIIQNNYQKPNSISKQHLQSIRKFSDVNLNPSQLEGVDDQQSENQKVQTLSIESSNDQPILEGNYDQEDMIQIHKEDDHQNDNELDCIPPYVLDENQYQQDSLEQMIINSQNEIDGNQSNANNQNQASLSQSMNFNQQKITQGQEEYSFIRDCSTNFYNQSYSGMPIENQIYSNLQNSIINKIQSPLINSQASPVMRDTNEKQNQIKFQQMLDLFSQSDLQEQSYYVDFLRDFNSQDTQYQQNSNHFIPFDIHSKNNSQQLQLNTNNQYNHISHKHFNSQKEKMKNEAIIQQQKVLIKNSPIDSPHQLLNINSCDSQSKIQQNQSPIQQLQQQSKQDKVQKFRPVQILGSRIEMIQKHGRGRPKKVEKFNIHWQKVTVLSNGEEKYEFFDYECKAEYLKKTFPIFYIDFLEKERNRNSKNQSSQCVNSQNQKDCCVEN